jgi:hypothetical protein
MTLGCKLKDGFALGFAALVIGRSVQAGAQSTDVDQTFNATGKAGLCNDLRQLNMRFVKR